MILQQRLDSLQDLINSIMKVKEKVKVKSLISVQLFETPWTVACQASLSMEFSRQEYWSGLPFPSPGIFPTQESNPSLLNCRRILYPLDHQGSPVDHIADA